MGDKKYADVFGENKQETHEAVLLDDGYQEIWIAKSIMEEWPEKGDTGDFVMEEWAAIENDLI